MLEAWKDFMKVKQREEFLYYNSGDMMNNATKTSVSSVYEKQCLLRIKNDG